MYFRGVNNFWGYEAKLWWWRGRHLKLFCPQNAIFSRGAPGTTTDSTEHHPSWYLSAALCDGALMTGVMVGRWLRLRENGEIGAFSNTLEAFTNPYVRSNLGYRCKAYIKQYIKCQFHAKWVNPPNECQSIGYGIPK